MSIHFYSKIEFCKNGRFSLSGSQVIMVRENLLLDKNTSEKDQNTTGSATIGPEEQSKDLIKLWPTWEWLHGSGCII